MVTKGMPVAFCSSDCCIGGRRRDHDQGPTDAEDDGTSLRPELLRAVDFYASILAMAAHDLRQPLQVIVGALELLSRRVTEGPAQAHLERGEQASAQLMEKLEQLADALHICRHFGKICDRASSGRDCCSAPRAAVRWTSAGQRDRFPLIADACRDHESASAARRDLAQSRAQRARSHSARRPRPCRLQTTRGDGLSRGTRYRGRDPCR